MILKLILLSPFILALGALVCAVLFAIGNILYVLGSVLVSVL